MRKIIISLGALTLGLALASVPAFAQSSGGPGGQNYGAGSNPQTGGANYQSNNAQKPLYNAVPPHQQSPQNNAPSAGPAGPGGANYGAGSNPQNGK
jgi:hypothetical protein